jgi:drug/metabolite transporter (DMT)-like permease
MLLFAQGLLSAVLLSFWIVGDIRVIVRRSGIGIWIRGIFGALSVWMLFQNLKSSSVGNALALASLSPAILLMISWVTDRKTIRRVEAIGVFGTLAGLIMLLRPSGAGMTTEVLIRGVAGSCFSATAYLALKRVSGHSNYLTVTGVFYFCIAILGVRGLGEFRQSSIEPLTLICILAISIFSLLGQAFMSLSFRTLPSATAALLSQTSIAWGALLSVIVLHEPIDAVTFAAYIIMCGSLWVLSRAYAVI